MSDVASADLSPGIYKTIVYAGKKEASGCALEIEIVAKLLGSTIQPRFLRNSAYGRTIFKPNVANFIETAFKHQSAIPALHAGSKNEFSILEIIGLLSLASTICTLLATTLIIIKKRTINRIYFPFLSVLSMLFLHLRFRVLSHHSFVVLGAH
jgi:hypothetical protein